MTIIGPNAHFTGDIISDDDVVIEGRFEGSVHVPEATVTIGEQAQVQADIRGARVRVLGELRGSITASVSIELMPPADVQGMLSANQVVIVVGAIFNGRIDMAQRTIALKVAQYKADQAVAPQKIAVPAPAPRPTPTTMPTGS